MKVNNSAIIEAAVSVDRNRACLQNPYLDKDRSRLVATNGKIMAIVPVELEEHDVSGFVSPAALKAARKLARKGDVQITCNGSLSLTDGTQLVRPMENNIGTFPNYAAVLPDFDAPAKFTVAIDAELLAQLNKAMGGAENIVTLRFNDELTAIRVTKSGTDAKGVLMPCRIS